MVEENQTLSEDKQNRFCSCPYERMSEADTEYLDFTPASPLKCNYFDEDCFCHQTDDMSSSISMNQSGVNVIKRQYNTNRRMIKIRIKTSSSKECSVEGESTENGIKICISPRRKDDEKINQTQVLNETYSVISSEIGSSSVETDYEFRKNIKNELRRSPAAVKVLNYLESLSEAKKKSPDKVLKGKKRSKNNLKPVIDTVSLKNSEKFETKSRRSKSKTPEKRVPTPKSFTSIDDEEFHDCCDKTTISSGTGTTSEYEDTTESFDTSQDCRVNDAPLITITQEMSTEMVVTSKFEINKEKLKRMNERRTSKGSPDKIIDDNFCNEILDKMNQLKINSNEKDLDECLDNSDTEKKLPCDSETSNTSVVSPGPKKPPRTFAYRRSQDNNPKPPKTEEIRLSLESLDMYLYEEMKQLKLFKFNQSRKVAPVLDESNYVVGGWKVSPSKEPVVSSSKQSLRKQEIGWTTPVQSPKRMEPGWVHSPTIPTEIVNMLHYSDDERKRRNILSSNAAAEPQQRSSASEK